MPDRNLGVYRNLPHIPPLRNFARSISEYKTLDIGLQLLTLTCGHTHEAVKFIPTCIGHVICTKCIDEYAVTGIIRTFDS